MGLQLGTSTGPARAAPLTLIENFDLTGHNTFGLSSHARFGALIPHAETVPLLAQAAQEKGLPLLIVGGGSNLLLRENIDAVVGVMDIKGREIVSADDHKTLVTAQAGEDWHAFVEWTVNQGMWGLENLALIPGTVGAAPVQNIGAYGVELADRFYSLEAWDLADSKRRTFLRDDCAFAYRNSRFKTEPGRYVILSVTFALPRPWQPVLTYAGLDKLPPNAAAPDVMHLVMATRQSKLPDWRVTGNAGSFFHNPVVSADKAAALEGAPRYPQADGRVKLSAGWLIDQSGFKGVQHGAAGVHPSHALVLVNNGGATHAEISELRENIRSGVKARFGVDLVQEPIEW